MPPTLPASTLQLEVALCTLPRTKQQKTPASSLESTNSPGLGPKKSFVGTGGLCRAQLTRPSLRHS